MVAQVALLQSIYGGGVAGCRHSSCCVFGRGARSRGVECSCSGGWRWLADQLRHFPVLVLLFGYAVWMLLRICLAFPVSVVEQIGVRSAIRRASVLSKGTKGRIFLLYLLGVALGWILAIGFMLPVTILLGVSSWTNNPQHAQMLGMILLFTWYGLWFAVQAFTKPVYGIALTMFYFDQRIRKEGFDIEWKMRQAGLTSHALERTEGVVWRPARGNAEPVWTPEPPDRAPAVEPHMPGVPPT